MIMYVSTSNQHNNEYAIHHYSCDEYSEFLTVIEQDSVNAN